MKKLIMFLMVLAIGVPAPATIEDVSPPVWGGTTPSANVVWQIDTAEYGVPSCTAYEPSDEDPEFYFGSHGGGPTGTWDPCEGTFTLLGGDFLHALVEVPGGVGENLTIRVQIAMEGEPDFEETNLELWASEKDSFGAEMATNAVEDPPGSGVWVQEGTFTPSTPGLQGPEYLEPGNIIGILNGGPFTMTGMIIDVIRHNGAAPTSGSGRTICGVGLPNPIIIDPNVMLVYETDETEGDFGVSLRNEPPEETTVTVTVDPNEAAKDITLIGGDPCEGGTITFIFDANNWDVPQPVVFKAIDDDIAEPPELEEQQRILVSSVYSEPLQDPNWAGEKIVTVNVFDNDQANIMFRVTPSRGGPKASVTGPVQLWEQGTAGDLIKWRKIGFQLQVQPSGDPVKLNAEVTGEIEGDNLPPTDPCLPIQATDDPNCFTYTSTTSSNGLPAGCPDHDLANKTTCWNVDQNIKIWGNDDKVLQAEWAEQEGDQNYQAVLEVTVIDDGGDERYADLAEDDPKTVKFNIEDNECGAYGISYLDVGNPNALTDPNYQDEEGNPLPDCHVDLYDVIEFATQWLDCSDPQDPACESYL